MEFDDRSVADHLVNRCLLSRKPYRDKYGQKRVRVTCLKSCRRDGQKRICMLTKQPEA